MKSLTRLLNECDSLISEMATKRRAFKVPAKQAEQMVITHLLAHQTKKKNKGDERVSISPADIERAKKISKAIHNHIGVKEGDKPESYDVSANGFSEHIRNNLGIKQAGRHVEDAIVSHKGHHYLLDMKMGPNGTGANLSASTFSGLHGIEGIPSETKGSKASEKHDTARRITDHFNHILNHEKREDAVKKALNVHENVPKNVTRLQIQDSTNGTEIHNSDHIWNHFKENFKPTRYSAEHSGNTSKVFAHNEKGESMHLYSVGVKNKTRGSSNINYNIKHRLTNNLASSKYGLPESSKIIQH